MAVARTMRAEHKALGVIAERFGISRATACRWTAGVLPPRPTKCSTEGCSGKPYSRGRCGRCSKRFRRHGDVTVTLIAQTEDPVSPALKAYLVAFDAHLRAQTEAEATATRIVMIERLFTATGLRPRPERADGRRAGNTEN